MTLGRRQNLWIHDSLLVRPLLAADVDVTDGKVLARVAAVVDALRDLVVVRSVSAAAAAAQEAPDRDAVPAPEADVSHGGQ